MRLVLRQVLEINKETVLNLQKANKRDMNNNNKHEGKLWCGTDGLSETPSPTSVGEKA